MDMYRTLNVAVPQLLFTMLHRAGPTVSEEEFIRTVTALHMDIRHQAQEIGEELHRWLEQQYRQQALETVHQLQRLAALAEQLCPVSNALRNNVVMQLNAHLES